MPHDLGHWRAPVDIPPRTDEERAAYEMSEENPPFDDMPDEVLDDIDRKRKKRHHGESRHMRLSEFDRERLDGVPEPKAPIRATPYVWRDPATIPPRPWLFGRWLLRGTCAAAVAAGGMGKTTWIAGAVMSLVSANPYFGKSVWGGPKRVWLWNLEDPLDEMARAIQAAALHYGLSESDLEGRLFIDTAMDGAGLCTAVEDAAGFRLIKPVYEQITAELIARQIDVLVIDPFVSSHEVEENANTKIDSIAKAWARVAHDANASVILVHHTSKAGAVEVTALSARGAVALVNACRSALVFNRMSEDEAARFSIEDDAERRRYFTVQDDKHNRAPAEQADWFKLVSVDLGNGGEGFGDSVGVATRWSPPDPFDGLTGDHLYRVQIAIADGSYREDWQSPAWAGVAVANVLGLDAKAKADRARIRRLLATWIANGALSVVDRPDNTSRPRKWIEVGQWQNNAVSPPRNGGVENGGEGGAEKFSTTTPPPEGVVGGERGRVVNPPVEKSNKRTAVAAGDPDNVEFDR